MKSFKLFLICLCFFGVKLQGQIDSLKLKITHLVGDYFGYTTYHAFNGLLFPSNSMYLVSDSGVVMFDTPWDSTQFQPLLDSIWTRHHKKVVFCIATHYHADRTAGLEFLNQKGIKTYTSYQTYRLCAIHHEKQSSFFFLNDTSFSVGQYRFNTFYPGEGHTPDNIVLWFDTEKILYGGCLIKSTENTSLGNIADANLILWPLTMKKLIKKFRCANYVIPGHFGWLHKKSLRHTLRLLKQNR